jgi:hypothetical protein
MWAWFVGVSPLIGVLIGLGIVYGVRNSLVEKSTVPMKTWIASIPANYSDKNELVVWRFYYQLYIDNTGKRSYTVTGKLPYYSKYDSRHGHDTAEEHPRYSQVILPWMKCSGDDYLAWAWQLADRYNPTFWDDYPEIVELPQQEDTGNPKSPKPKTKAKSNGKTVKNQHEFKLLTFPEKKEEKSNDVSPESV